MSEKQEMDSQPPAYDQACPPPGGGYSPEEAGFPTQPAYNPVSVGHNQPPHGYPSLQGPPYVGMSQQSSTVVVTNQPYMTTTMVTGRKPPDYMACSILACLCCFWPTGICAIIYASKRNGLVSEGNYLEATRMATISRNLIIASVILGIVWMAISILEVTLLSHTTHSDYGY